MPLEIVSDLGSIKVDPCTIDVPDATGLAEVSVPDRMPHFVVLLYFSDAIKGGAGGGWAVK
jgi:hypothetical protein